MTEADAPSGTGPLVFISYAHDDERHKDDVLTLARFLTTRGIRVELDIWNNATRRDWPAWITDRLGVVDYVLVIASARYREVADGNAAGDLHRGVQFEAAALRDLLYADRRTWLPKLLPVLLPGHDLTELPLFLQPYTASHFRVKTVDDAGTEQLLRVLLGVPSKPGVVLPSSDRSQVSEPVSDLVLTPEDLDAFTREITAVFREHEAIRLLRLVGYDRRDVPDFLPGNRLTDWATVFQAIDDGKLGTPTPYRDLLRQALKRYPGNAVFLRVEAEHR